MRDKTSQNKQNTDNKRVDLSNKKMLTTFMVIALLTLLIIIYISLYVQISNRNFQVERLKEKRQQLESENTQIQLEISRLQSIRRIEDVAINQLEMKRPERVEYIILSNNSEDKEQEERVSKQETENIFSFITGWLSRIMSVEAGQIK